LGRLAAGKGIEYLLEATAVLAKRLRIQFSVNIVGDGPSRVRLESIAKALGVQQIVSFAGHQKDVSEYLRASDLVVLPTFREGMSISLLEAMAAGKPIVTTNIGSNKEATRNGYAAILVEPGDVAALADAVQNVIEDPKLASALSRRSRECYQEDYTLERMLSQYVRLYDELIYHEAG
jgi:glycosyltransferase involved in cell wall biosynthesis